MEAMETYYPGAMSNTELVSSVTSKLKSYGFTNENTLIATSLCADEVNRTLEHSLCEATTLENFSMGGLAGFPFGGVTAFGAMAHHIPDGGSW